MIMFRLSQNMESETKYFPLEFYSNIVYGVYDMAKLFDIAAIYGSSNKQLVSTMISSIFENEPRFQSDFKETFDMMLNVLKRIFKDALRTDQMIKGDAIHQKSPAEQDSIIIRLVKDMIEILTNFSLVTSNFGDLIMEQVSSTNFLVNLTNAYSLLRKIKLFWKDGCSTKQTKDTLTILTDSAIKLTIQISAEVL